MKFERRFAYIWETKLQKLKVIEVKVMKFLNHWIQTEQFWI